jgi:hypothetical protein
MIENYAGPGTAQTKIFGYAFTGRLPHSTRDRAKGNSRQSCAERIVRRAAHVDPYAAQPALALDDAPLCFAEQVKRRALAGVKNTQWLRPQECNDAAEPGAIQERP